MAVEDSPMMDLRKAAALEDRLARVQNKHTKTLGQLNMAEAKRRLDEENDYGENERPADHGYSNTSGMNIRNRLAHLGMIPGYSYMRGRTSPSAATSAEPLPTGALYSGDAVVGPTVQCPRPTGTAPRKVQQAPPPALQKDLIEVKNRQQFMAAMKQAAEEEKSAAPLAGSHQYSNALFGYRLSGLVDRLSSRA